MNGCPHCHEVLENVLPPLQEKYGAQLEVLLVEVISMEDVNRLYEVAASYGISRDRVGVPFLVIGDRVLIGSRQIPEELPGLIESQLAAGGVDFPSLPPRGDATVTPVPAVSPVEVTTHANGFTLAIVVMILMAIVLVYSLTAFAIGKTFSLPDWANWLVPILIVIGVAAYLSYVETQSVEAVCGPVGDCNAVQQSRFATLVGILPVGVLGLPGYLDMLAAWLTRKYLPKFAKPADIALFAMAFFTVIFSLYLTYLEPFVIRTVCIWCLTSAVIVTLLLGTPPAVLLYQPVRRG